jgi:hypothetical protein
MIDIDTIITRIIEEGHRSVKLYDEAKTLKDKKEIMVSLRTFIKNDINSLIDEEANATLSSLTEYQSSMQARDEYSAYLVPVLNFLIELFKKPIIERKRDREKK